MSPPDRQRRWGWGVIGVMMVLWGSCPVDAEPVGSPASILKKGKWFMGAGTSLLAKRNLKGNTEAAAYQGGHVRGYGLTDRLSLYGKLGLAHFEVDDGSIKKKNDLSTTNGFGLNVVSGVQIKSRFFESRSKRWEWDGSVQYLDMRARHKGKNEARWHEWQLATSVAASVHRLKPYVGVKYSVIDVFYRIREDGQQLAQGRYKEDQPVGLFLGTDWALGRYEDVILNVESAFVDGAEVAVTIAYTF